MRYLYRPTPAEELVVRGRYDFTNVAGETWATESWEQYRASVADMQVWRSEWQGERDKQPFAMLGHTLVSPDGVERLKLRLMIPAQPSRTVTLTPGRDFLEVSEAGEWQEVALPAGFGLVLPLPSLARFGFPFDLASENRELAMTYLVRPRLHKGKFSMRATKLEYNPLGLREIEVKGQTLRAKGWRAEVPGLPTREGWFDRNGTCLRWRVENGDESWEANLVEWMTFG